MNGNQKLTAEGIVQILQDNPHMMSFYQESTKREIYSKSGDMIIKKTVNLSGEVEKVEFIRRR